MATYKVIQDIEAEDKLIGPLSFRQFVYFLIGAFLAFVCFTVTASGAAFLLALLLPPTLFCFFFAFPWTPEQPTEVWALARIRFLVKSRKRVWDQSGIKDFVTVTVPKKIEKRYTDGLSQTEVRSRLQALAHTIDSRGWAVKNAYGGGGVVVTPVNDNTDRLLGFDAMPREVSTSEMRASDDILDEANNPAAHHMNEMIAASSKAHRQMLIDKMNSNKASATPVAQPAWFTQSQPVQPVVTVNPVQPAQTAPISQPVTAVQPVQPAAASDPKPEPIKTQADPAILNLAHDNNMDVATLAREAKRAKDLEASGDEVVVSLH